MGSFCVTFDEPKHGWIGFLIRAEDGSFGERVSYTPYDFFHELITSLSALVEGDCQRSVRGSTEPERFELRFERVGDRVSLLVVSHAGMGRASNGEVRMKTTGTFAEVCLPFWDALRDLEARVPQAQWPERWHRSFPSTPMANLRRRMSDLGAAGGNQPHRRP